ncbi:MAG: proteasome assembly chaperone family protein [Haloarculaceae archaeon]
MPEATQFTVRADPGAATGDALVVGLAMPGMAGLSASDYLVKHLEFESIGHVTATEFPAIAPFENGRARQPMRLYAHGDANLTVLVCELFVPVWAAEAFANGVLSWHAETGLSEIALLHGIPFPHGPDNHEVYVTATDAYAEARLDGVDVEPLTGGFLDGVAGELVLRGLEADGVPVGTFVTPSHPPGPDLQAALLLLDGLQRTYGLAVDRAELERQAEELRQYYTELSERMQSMADGDQPIGSRDYPEDRMFM